ncbi:MAG: hypothetical protein ACXVO9_10180 [Bacteroidia bacterium]
METKNNMDEFLKKQMSVDESGINEPSLGLIRHAREKVMLKKERQLERADIFFLTAKFLNLHVKLSYVIMLTLCLGLGSLYFTKENVESNENITSPYIVNIASARSSTVLASIITFESRH